jgi:hypothetical protein
MQDGSYFSIVAACMYFIASIIVCTTPKPTPWIKRVKAEDDDTRCLACCTKKQAPDEEVAEKTVPMTDLPADSPDDVAAAVAAGAAASAAAGTAAAYGVEENAEKVDEDSEAAGSASTGDEDKAGEMHTTEGDEMPTAEGDEETGDPGGDEVRLSKVPSVAPSEPSQFGEEITLELSQIMVEEEN